MPEDIRHDELPPNVLESLSPVGVERLAETLEKRLAEDNPPREFRLDLKQFGGTVWFEMVEDVTPTLKDELLASLSRVRKIRLTIRDFKEQIASGTGSSQSEYTNKKADAEKKLNDEQAELREHVDPIIVRAFRRRSGPGTDRGSRTRPLREDSPTAPGDYDTQAEPNDRREKRSRGILSQSDASELANPPSQTQLAAVNRRGAMGVFKDLQPTTLDLTRRDPMQLADVNPVEAIHRSENFVFPGGVNLVLGTLNQEFGSVEQIAELTLPPEVYPFDAMSGILHFRILEANRIRTSEHESKDILTKPLETIEEARLYGVSTGRIEKLLQAFKPESSYLFVSPHLTGKSSLLTLLACHVIDNINRLARDFVIVRLHSDSGRRSVPPELLTELVAGLSRDGQFPILLVDDILDDKNQPLHRALVELRRAADQVIARTALWATASPEAFAEAEERTLLWPHLRKLFNSIEHNCPGMLDTSNRDELAGYYERLSQIAEANTLGVYEETIQQVPFVSMGYLCELWRVGKRSPASTLRDDIKTVPFDANEIFGSMYGDLTAIERSLLGIACYLPGISFGLCLTLCSDMEGTDCEEQLESMVSRSILHLTKNETSAQQTEKTVEVIAGIQAVALAEENFTRGTAGRVTETLIECCLQDEIVFDESMSHLERLLPNMPPDQRAMFRQAILSNRSAMSLGIASRHLRTFPDLAELWYDAITAEIAADEKARILLSFAEFLALQCRTQEATACLARAADEQPTNRVIRLKLARKYFASGDVDTAVRTLKPAFDKSADDRATVMAYSYLLTRKKSVKYARTQLERRSARFPDRGWLAYATSLLWILEEANWEKALEWGDRAVERLPKERDVVVSFANVHRRLMDVTQHRVQMEKLAKNYPDSGWIAYFASLAYVSGDSDWKKAINWAERAVRLLPNEQEVVNGFAAVSRQAIEVDALRIELEELANEFQESGWLAHYVAWAWTLEDANWDNALEWSERAVRRLPNEPSVLFDFLIALRHATSLEQTRGKLEDFAEKFKQNAYIASCAAWAWSVERPNKSKFLEWGKRALAADPDNPQVVSNFVTTLRDLVDVGELRIELGKLADEYPHSGWLADYAAWSWVLEEPVWQTVVRWSERAVALLPNEKVIVNRLAVAVRFNSGVEGLRKRLKELAEKHPGSAWLANANYSAWILEEPHWEKAVEWSERAVRLLPGEREIVANWVVAVNQISDAADLRRRVEELAEKYPSSGWLADYASWAWTLEEPHWEKAVEWSERAVRVLPDEQEIVASWAVAVNQISDVTNLRRRVEELAETYPYSGWLAIYASSLWTLEEANWEKALEWGDRAVERLPKERDVVVSFANVHRRLMDVTQHRVQMEKLAKNYPDSGWIAYFASLAYVSGDSDWKKAINWAERAVRLLPNEQEVVNGFAAVSRQAIEVDALRIELEELANEFQESGWLAHYVAWAWTLEDANWDNALEWSERAVRRLPNEPSVLFDFLIALRHATSLEQTRGKLEDFAEKFKQNAYIASCAAWAWSVERPNKSKFLEWGKRALAADPDNPQVVSNFVTTLRDLVDVGELRIELGKLADEYPHSGWLADYAAWSWVLEEPVWQTVVRWSERAVALLPNEKVIVNRLAVAVRFNSGVEGLRKRLKELAEKHPGSAWLANANYSAWILEEPHWEKAVEWSERAVRLLPGEREIVANWVVAVNQISDAADLRRRVEELAEKYPSSGWLADYASWAWTLEEPHWEKAVEWSERAVRVLPDEQEIVASWAVAVNQISDVTNLRRRVEELAETYPYSGWLAIYASSLWTLEEANWEKALEWGDRAVERSPDDENIVYHYLSTSQQSVKLIGPVSHFEQLADRFSDSPWVAYAAAFELEDSNPNKAIEMAERAVSLLPLDRRVVSNLANLLKTHRGLNESRVRFEELCEAYPNSAWLFDFAAWLWSLDEADWPKAGACSRRAVALEPNEPSIVNFHAWILKQSLKPKEVQTQLKELAATYRQSGWLADIVAFVFEETDQMCALEWSQRAVENLPYERDIVRYFSWLLKEHAGPSQMQSQLLELFGTYADSAWLADAVAWAFEDSDLEKAFTYSERAVRLLPRDIDIVYYFAALLAKHDNRNDRRTQLEELANTYPDSYWLAMSVAWESTDDDGNVEKALDWATRAIVLEPSNATLVGEYAAVIEKVTDKDEARARLEYLVDYVEAPDAIKKWLADSYWRDDLRNVMRALQLYRQLSSSGVNTIQLESIVRKCWCMWELGSEIDVSDLVSSLTRSQSGSSGEDAESGFREAAEVFIALNEIARAREWLKKGHEQSSIGRWAIIDPVLEIAAAVAGCEFDEVLDVVDRLIEGVEHFDGDINWNWSELKRWIEKSSIDESQLLVLAIQLTDEDTDRADVEASLRKQGTLLQKQQQSMA